MGDESDRGTRIAAPQRASYALELLEQGKRYGEVRRLLRERFGIGRATAERDIKRAYSAIADEDQAELPQLKARISAYQWRIAAEARAAGKYAAASTALGRLARLHGLEAPTKVEVEGLDPNQLQLLKALQMTPAERQRRLAELEAGDGEDPGEGEDAEG